MEDKRLIPLWITGGLLLLSAIYAGSYLALVQRGGLALGPRISKYADYRFGGLYAARFFYPAHVIDRKIRPEFWADEHPFEF